MLVIILRIDTAVTVSIKIMDAFIEMRKFLNSSGQVLLINYMRFKYYTRKEDELWN